MSLSGEATTFDAFYSTIGGRLAQFEPRRRRAMWKYLAVLAATLVIAAAVSWTLLEKSPLGQPGYSGALPLFAIAVAIPVVLINMYAWFEITGQYQTDTTVGVLGALVPAAHAGLKYLGAESITEEELARYGLFGDLDYNRFSGTDDVSGRVGELDVRFSSVELQRFRTSNGKSSTTTEFEGVVFDAKRSEPFGGRTYVLPDTSERLLGSVGRAMQAQKSDLGERITMPDAEFEKRFIVYASDADEAHRILTPQLMRRLVELRDRLKRRVRMAFVDDRIFVAIDGNESLFAPPVFRSLLRPALYRRVWDRVRLFAGLSTDLGLENVGR